MKKAVSFLLILALVLTVVFGIVACDAISDAISGSITDPQLKKVHQAFDGVESSMTKKSSSLEAAVQANKALYFGAESGLDGDAGVVTNVDPLTAIWNVFVPGDLQANADPDLEYDQPPMRQFQYLKAVFNEMGNGYVLGTKYYYDITGQVYFDMETGYAVNPSKIADPTPYQYNYVFGFSMSVDLRENDLIFAEVGFEITLTQGTAKYQTSWYVSFDLDYDFDEKTPTYTLTMLTDNKESDLPYLHRVQGYECDYVQVNKGAIKEWRKFVMDTDEEILLDDAHPSFSAYLSEGASYRVDTCKWLKDGKYYKITQMDDSKMRTLVLAYVDGIGMNSTAINGAAFFAKSGEKNSVIDTYYKSICNLYGGDILYDLVCKKKDNDDGGNGGSTHAWDSSVGTLVAAVSSLVPGFESATATFTAVTADEGVWITVSNATADDYTRFKESLARAGFNRLGEQDGAEIFLKTTDGGNVAVAIDTARNYIGVSASSGNANNDAITMLHALPYTYGYIGYDKRQFGAAKDLYQIIETISFRRITQNELGGLSANDSFLYDITLPFDPALGMSMEESAAETAAKYGADYKNDDTWTNMERNMLNYATIDGKEVLVLIASDVSEGEAHLYVYMLQFEQGNIPQILNTDGSNPGGGVPSGGNEDPEGDNGDNGGSSSGGGNGVPSSGGGNGGENGGPSGGSTVNIVVYLLDAYKNIVEDGMTTYTFTEGASVSVARFLTEDGQKDGQKVYLNSDCSEQAGDTVKVTADLQLYVWKEPQKSTFTIYDVTEEGTVLYDQRDEVVGYNFDGYQYDYLLYTDEGCKSVIPVDATLTLTEEGITVYRHLYDGLFVLEIKTYINGHLFTTDSSIHKKEKIYPAFAPFGAGIVNDYIENSYYGPAEYYLGDGKNAPLTAASHLATSEDKLTVSIYVTSADHHVYTLKAGDTVLTREYITTFGEFDEFNYAEGMGNPFSYKNKSAEYCTVSGSEITMHNVSTLLGPLTVYYAWKGQQLCADTAYDTCYFNEASYQSFTGEVGASTTFFTDVTCSTPLMLKDTGNGYGEFVVKSAMTLYRPVNFASVY